MQRSGSARGLGRGEACALYARRGSATLMDGRGRGRRRAPGSSQDRDRLQPNPLPSSAWPWLPLGSCSALLGQRHPQLPLRTSPLQESGTWGRAHASVRRLAHRGAACGASWGAVHLCWSRHLGQSCVGMPLSPDGTLFRSCRNERTTGPSLLIRKKRNDKIAKS